MRKKQFLMEVVQSVPKVKSEIQYNQAVEQILKTNTQVGRDRPKSKTGNPHRKVGYGRRTNKDLANNTGKLTGMSADRKQVHGRLNRLTTDWLTENAGGVPAGMDGIKAGKAGRC